MKLVYLGLGSNIGDRGATIQFALKQLQCAQVRLLRTSSIYETEPIGLKDQPWFLNLVAEFETELEAQPLLEHIQRIERLLGRVRTIPNGPRTIDIDILLYEQTVYQSETLTIPHPRYHERRFTLAPLAELSPSLRDPVTGQTMLEMLSALQGQTARPIATEPEQS